MLNFLMVDFCCKWGQKKYWKVSKKRLTSFVFPSAADNLFHFLSFITSVYCSERTVNILTEEYVILLRFSQYRPERHCVETAQQVPLERHLW